MGFVEGKDLPVSIAVIAPAGYGVALQCRLRTHIFLERIEAMHRVLCTELLKHIPGELIDLHRSGCKCDVVISAVRQRNERRQFSSSRTAYSGDSRPLVRGVNRLARRIHRRSSAVRQHRAVLQNSLVLAEALIAGEKEGMVPPDRSANSRAKVIALQGCFFTRKSDQWQSG